MIIGAGLSGAIDGSRDYWATLIGFLLNLGLFAAGALILCGAVGSSQTSST